MLGRAVGIENSPPLLGTLLGLQKAVRYLGQVADYFDPRLDSNGANVDTGISTQRIYEPMAYPTNEKPRAQKHAFLVSK